jgi:hypothetical protein
MAVTPALIPDLFDAKPIVVHARYAQPGSGTVIVRGRTGSGPWERRISVQLAGPGSGNASDMLPSLWARSQVDDALAPVLKELEQDAVPSDVRRRVTSLGEGWQVMTPFTSFVAIEKARVTIGGRALLVPVPIELPQGTRFDGVFGEWRGGPIPAIEGVSRGVFGSARADGQDQTFGITAETGQSAPSVAGAVPAEASSAPPPSAVPAQRAGSIGSPVAVPNTAPASVARPKEGVAGRVGGRADAESRTRRLGGGDSRGESSGVPSGVSVGGGVGFQGQGSAGGFSGGASGKMESMASRPAEPATPADRGLAPEAESLRRSQNALTDAKNDGSVDALNDVPAEARDASNAGEAAGEPAAPVAPAEEPVIVLHDARDLVGLGADAAIVTQATERLVHELQKLTGRELWTDQGGRSAAWSAQDGLLRIEAWPSLQRMIDGALRTRRSAMSATGGIDRDLVPAESGAAITALRARITRPLTTTELDRAWDLLGADLFRAALLGAPPSATSSTMPDGSIWISIAATEPSALGALAARLSEPGINEAARVVVGRLQPARLAELVQDPAVMAVNTIPAP